MTDTAKVAKNLQAFRIAVASHDRENTDHPAAYGIAMHTFDLERLGFEEGEELWSGICIYADDGTTGNFRVLCDLDKPEHEQMTRAVSRELAL